MNEITIIWAHAFAIVGAVFAICWAIRGMFGK